MLGIINGGLGIRLAARSPFQTNSQTRTAGIAYGVVAGFMFALYAILVILFEIRRKRAQSGFEGTAHAEQRAKERLPTYDESMSGSSNEQLNRAASRYQ